MPPSTMMPPIDVPWPPMNLVAECTTMSAPCSIGRISHGLATVLSTISGHAGLVGDVGDAADVEEVVLGLPMVSP